MLAQRVAATDFDQLAAIARQEAREAPVQAFGEEFAHRSPWHVALARTCLSRRARELRLARHDDIGENGDRGIEVF